VASLLYEIYLTFIEGFEGWDINWLPLPIRQKLGWIPPDEIELRRSPRLRNRRGTKKRSNMMSTRQSSGYSESKLQI